MQKHLINFYKIGARFIKGDKTHNQLLLTLLYDLGYLKGSLQKAVDGIWGAGSLSAYRRAIKDGLLYDDESNTLKIKTGQTKKDNSILTAIGNFITGTKPEMIDVYEDATMSNISMIPRKITSKPVPNQTIIYPSESYNFTKDVRWRDDFYNKTQEGDPGFGTLTSIIKNAHNFEADGFTLPQAAVNDLTKYQDLDFTNIRDRFVELYPYGYGGSPEEAMVALCANSDEELKQTQLYRDAKAKNIDILKKRHDSQKGRAWMNDVLKNIVDAGLDWNAPETFDLYKKICDKHHRKIEGILGNKHNTLTNQEKMKRNLISFITADTINAGYAGRSDLGYNNVFTKSDTFKDYVHADQETASKRFTYANQEMRDTMNHACRAYLNKLKKAQKAGKLTFKGTQIYLDGKHIGHVGKKGNYVLNVTGDPYEYMGDYTIVSEPDWGDAAWIDKWDMAGLDHITKNRGVSQGDRIPMGDWTDTDGIVSQDPDKQDNDKKSIPQGALTAMDIIKELPDWQKAMFLYRFTNFGTTMSALYDNINDRWND